MLKKKNSGEHNISKKGMIIMDKAIKIKVEKEYKFGGKIIATANNKEVGWLRYHHDLDNHKKVEISILEVRNGYELHNIEKLLLSYVSQLLPKWRYKVTYNYQNAIQFMHKK